MEAPNKSKTRLYSKEKQSVERKFEIELSLKISMEKNVHHKLA